MCDFIKENVDLKNNQNVKGIGSNWYICNTFGVWNLVNFQGTDAVSINFSKKIDCKTFVEDFYGMHYDELVIFIEDKCNKEANRGYFDKYIIN